MNRDHLSVLPAEIASCFAERRYSTFVDGTLGAGGHAERMVKEHPELNTFIGIDQDPQALAIARKRLAPWQEKIIFIQDNVAQLQLHLDQLQIESVDGILLDLGVSSMQLDRPEKGFSFMHEGPLDMRMNPDAPLSAKEIVNSWPEKELCRIFREYGEEKQWRAAASVICRARKQAAITTTTELVTLLMPLLGWKRAKGMHPLTLIFQALRICVNDELAILKRILPQAIERLAPQGRLAVITFHSLEDRLVKEAFRQAASDKQDTSGLGGGLFLAKKPEGKLITSRPITPTAEEVANNPRSRSAKLRILEKSI